MNKCYYYSVYFMLCNSIINLEFTKKSKFCEMDAPSIHPDLAKPARLEEWLDIHAKCLARAGLTKFACIDAAPIFVQSKFGFTFIFDYIY